MATTYSQYTGYNYGICIGLCAIVSTAVLLIFCTSNKGKKFVYKRIIAVELEEIDEDGSEETSKGVVSQQQKEKKLTERSVKIVSAWFCLFAIITFSLSAVLIFQRCILSSTRILPDDPCPDNYPMDCFVFNSTSYLPLSENVTFRCDPLNTTQFPANLVNASALCFGWIIKYQSTENVLNQLGICTGLLGLFTAMLALIVFLDQSILVIILGLIFIDCSIVAIILLFYFKWSYSFLTYFVLALGILLGLFGINLYHILLKLPKNVPNEQTTGLNPTQVNRSTPSNAVTPFTSPPPGSKLKNPSAKVTRK